LTVDQAVLLHRYSFVSDASDSVGGANGTIVAPNGGSAASIANGLSLPGVGGSGYLALPAGILTNTASITVECWVTMTQPNTWATIWDFGNNGNQNFELCPVPASGRNSGNMIGAFTPNGGEVDLSTPTAFPVNSEQYVCETFNANTLVADIYTNGVLDASAVLPNATYIPGTIGGANGTSENWLGNDVYNDPQFSGTVYEFRIWNGAVSPLYTALSSVAGPGVVISNLTPVSLSVSVSTSIIAGETAQASAIGTFQTESGVPVNGVITNWTSSNPSVLTVNGSGLITAVNAGSATVSATFNGITGVSATITVPETAPVITQEPNTNLDLLAGGVLDANIAVAGNPPFVYYWFFNGGAQPVYIATNSSTLTLSDLQAADAGSYTVLVSNVNGTVTSSTITVTVSTPTPYEQVLLQLNPIAYWPLNETAGTTAFDLIGGNNGTYTNVSAGVGVTLAQPGPSAAIFGNNSLAASFDGVGGVVDIPEGPFNITGAITVVAWVQLAYVPGGFDGLFGHGDASWRTSVNNSAEPGASDGSAGDATAPSTATLSDLNWHMVAYTYTGALGANNNGALYLDGAPVAYDTVTTAPAGDNLDVYIGGAPDYNNRFVAANIADASVFTYALTGAQVQGLYTGVFVTAPNYITIGRSGSDVVLTWHSGILLEASSVTGPWTAVSGATSPYSVPVTAGGVQFFRVQVNP
jgi:hypothetical protein